MEYTAILCLLHLLNVIASNLIIIDDSYKLNLFLCSQGPQILESNTQLLLSPKVTHKLQHGKYCLISNLSNVTIKSQHQDMLANISCNSTVDIPNAGFGFYNVSNLIIKDVNITYCGGHVPANLSYIFHSDGIFDFSEKLLMTLVISNSSNISIVNFHTLYCNGLSLVLLNSHNRVLLQDLTVTKSNKGKYTFSSGLLIMMNNYSNQKCSIDIYNCKLVQNGAAPYVNNTDLPSLFTTGSLVPVNIFAACLTVLFSKGNYNSVLNINNLDIIYCFGGYFGGFAAISYGSPVNKTQITIRNLFAHHNLFGMMGSVSAIGVFIFCLNEDYKQINSYSPVWRFFLLEDSNITDSPFTHIAYQDYDRPMNLASMMFISAHLCCISINVTLSSIGYTRKYYGYRSPLLFVRNTGIRKSLESPLVVYIRNFKLISEHNVPPGYVTAIDYGKMIFINVDLHIIGDSSCFVNQMGSIIQAYNTDVHFKGSAKFIQNKASKGAAISLHSFSHLYIYETTNITFEKNRAFFYGGALFSDVDERINYFKPLCAIQVVFNKSSSLKPVMTFKDNWAGRSGMSVYMDPLYNCKQVHTPMSTINLKYLYSKIFTFYNSMSTTRQADISSVPVEVDFCEKSTKTLHKTVYPGQTINLQLQAHDRDNHTPYSMIQARFTENLNKTDIDIPLQITKNQEFQIIFSNTCTTLNYTIIPTKLRFKALKMMLSVQGYAPTLYVGLTIQQCPIGFYYKHNIKTCDCAPFLTKRGIEECIIDKTEVKIPQGSWLGVIDGLTTLGYSNHCPTGYCKQSLNVNISNSDDVCTGNRQGILCGQCQDGYSVVMGSVDCHRCGDSSVYVILVYMGAAVIYVIVLFMLRITIDVGTIGGLVFWLDGMMVANDLLFYSFGYQRQYTDLYFIVLDAFQCRWQVTTCLYNGMGSIIKQTIDFTTSIMLWILVGLIILASRCSTKISNIIVGSGVQVLATVMYISFSDLFISCLQVLTPAYVYISNVTTPLVVWYTDGSVLYGKESGHIGLMCVSIITLLLFIIPYVLFGLFGKKLMKFYYVSKYFRPFIEALHGPYKDRQRHWFGIRLLVLCTMFIIHCSCGGRNLKVEIFFIFIVLGFYTTSLAVFMPFKSKFLNGLELVLSALLLLYFITIFLFYNEENKSRGAQLSVISIATLIGMAIVVYHLNLACKKLRSCNYLILSKFAKT